MLLHQAGGSSEQGNTPPHTHTHTEYLQRPISANTQAAFCRWGEGGLSTPIIPSPGFGSSAQTWIWRSPTGIVGGLKYLNNLLLRFPSADF